jgi:hypothetical protein
MRHALAFVVSSALVAGSLAGTIAGHAPAAIAAPQCVNTKISKTEFYFPGQAGSGYVVIFASTLGVGRFANTYATIVDRYSSAGSPISRARAGDAIKLCLTQTPQAGQGCDPNKDNRGRIYSAYDSRLRATFSGANSNHGCGGA